MSKVLMDEMLKKLHEIRRDMGRTPSRPEFLLKSGYSTEQIIAACGGGFQRLIELSGLKYMAKGKRDKQEIRKEVHQHMLETVEAQRKAILPPQIYHRVLCIGDTHFPYAHPDAVAWLIALNRKYKFDRVYSVGDEVDYHALSFHDKDPDLMSAGPELEAAIKMMQPLYKEFPIVTLAESNHGSMLYRKGKHHGIPRRLLAPYGKAIEAPDGWTWEEKIRFQTPNGQMHLIAHSLGANVLAVAKSRGMNVIEGHHHESFGVQFFHNEEKNQPMYGAFTGCLIDDLSYAYAYNKTNKFRPIMGSLGILDSVPIPFPMFLDRHGRWNGVLP